jgi:hypothetical protein
MAFDRDMLAYLLMQQQGASPTGTPGMTTTPTPMDAPMDVPPGGLSGPAGPEGMAPGGMAPDAYYPRPPSGGYEDMGDELMRLRRGQ